MGISVWFCAPRPEALLKRRTPPPSTPRTPSARSGSLNTSPSDWPRTCRHKDSACQPNFEKMTKKNTEKKRKNVKTICSLLSLIGLGINSLSVQSPPAVIRELDVINLVQMYDDPLPAVDWGETELNPNPDRQMSSLWSDLIVWFSLIVSLWTSSYSDNDHQSVWCFFSFFTS